MNINIDNILIKIDGSDGHIYIFLCHQL